MLAIAVVAYVDLQFLGKQDHLSWTVQPKSSEHQSAADPHTVILTSAHLTLALRELSEPFSLPEPTEETLGQGSLQWTHRRYELSLPRPRDFEEFVAPFLSVGKALPNAIVDVLEDKEFAELHYGVGGLRTHTIRFNWLRGRPRTCIIVTGLGRDLLATRELLSIQPRPSFAIDPFAPFADVVSERLASEGGEILLDWRYSPEQPADEERNLSQQLAEALQRLPRASGALLRAASSGITEPPPQAFLAQFRGRSPLLVVWPPVWATGVCRQAAPLAVRCTRADENLSEVAPDVLILRLVAERLTAEQIGERILLVPGDNALDILREELPRFGESGIDVVPLAELLRAPSRAANTPTVGSTNAVDAQT